jgi:hypothetical protein
MAGDLASPLGSKMASRSVTGAGAPDAQVAADLGGQRGSDGVVSDDTDLGDLRGNPQSSMSSAGRQVGSRLGGQSGRSNRRAPPAR